VSVTFQATASVQRTSSCQARTMLGNVLGQRGVSRQQLIGRFQVNEKHLQDPGQEEEHIRQAECPEGSLLVDDDAAPAARSRPASYNAISLNKEWCAEPHGH
jgi:hypothetical protein